MHLVCLAIMLLATVCRPGGVLAKSAGGQARCAAAAAVMTAANTTNSTASSSSGGATFVRAYISIGSNAGDRLASISAAMQQLRRLGRVADTSLLYETPPMYHTNQSSFLNAACLLETRLPPDALLKGLKQIEASIGRKPTFRNGPRAIDLDIALYGTAVLQIDGGLPLQVPHARMHERAFVLRPLCDIDPQLQHPTLGRTVQQLLGALPPEEVVCIRRVLPLGKALFGDDSVVLCGVLNVTPDSFSDGGTHFSITDAVAAALQMVADGADMIDVGGESTRPGATPVSEEEQVKRAVAAISAIRGAGVRAVLSVDTRSAAVARAAVMAGADVINDVSGGACDGDMIPTAAELGVPIVIMHMRGDPMTMGSEGNCKYGDVVAEVAGELQGALAAANECGIPRWSQVVDPGIGFSKKNSDSATLLQPSSVARLRGLLGGRALLVGASRKRVVKEAVSGSSDSGSVSNEALDRATAGVSCGAVAGGADIVRVHNCAVVGPAVRALKRIMTGLPTNHDK